MQRTEYGFPPDGGYRQWYPRLWQNGLIATLAPTENYYKVIMGDWFVAWGQLSVTGAGTGNNQIWILGLPYTPIPIPVGYTTGSSGSTNLRCVGSATYLDNGTGVYSGAMVIGDGPSAGNVAYGQGNPSSAMRIWTGNNIGDSLGVQPNFAVANNDMISYSISFPVLR